MPNTMQVEDWLNFVDAEYLSFFIRDGGTSVKFAVIPDESRPRLRGELERQAKDRGYVFAALDAASTRAHMPQDIFFEIAKQVDWRSLARRFILRQASRIGYRVEGIDADSQEGVYHAVASLAGIEPEDVVRDLRPIIVHEVAKNTQMVKDFRIAMTQLCSSENIQADGVYRAQPLIDWLTGANLRITPVKPFFVHTTINRTTARNLLESAAFWFRVVGYAGTVIFMDNSRVTLADNPRDRSRFYTKAMVMDHYELLREFVDESHRMTGVFMVVSPNDGFLDEDRSRGSRGYGIYEALMTRVMTDVRDRNLVNPAASLIQLT